MWNLKITGGELKILLLAGWPTFSSSCRCHCAASGSWKGQLDMEIRGVLVLGWPCNFWSPHVSADLAQRQEAKEVVFELQRSLPKWRQVWVPSVLFRPGFWHVKIHRFFIDFAEGPFDSPRVLYLACLTCWHLRWFSCVVIWYYLRFLSSWYNFLLYQGPRRCLTGSHRVLGADSQTIMFK